MWSSFLGQRVKFRKEASMGLGHIRWLGSIRRSLRRKWASSAELTSYGKSPEDQSFVLEGKGGWRGRGQKAWEMPE